MLENRQTFWLGYQTDFIVTLLESVTSYFILTLLECGLAFDAQSFIMYFENLALQRFGAHSLKKIMNKFVIIDKGVEQHGISRYQKKEEAI